MDEIVRQVVRTNERITTKQEDRMIDDIFTFFQRPPPQTIRDLALKHVAHCPQLKLCYITMLGGATRCAPQFADQPFNAASTCPRMLVPGA